MITTRFFFPRPGSGKWPGSAISSKGLYKRGKLDGQALHVLLEQAVHEQVEQALHAVHGHVGQALHAPLSFEPLPFCSFGSTVWRCYVTAQAIPYILYTL